MFIFGFFTQLAIAISHVDNYKAMRDSESVFSAAFAAAISILLVTANSSFNSHFVSIEILDDVSQRLSRPVPYSLGRGSRAIRKLSRAGSPVLVHDPEFANRRIPTSQSAVSG